MKAAKKKHGVKWFRAAEATRQADRDPAKVEAEQVLHVLISKIQLSM